MVGMQMVAEGIMTSPSYQHLCSLTVTGARQTRAETVCPARHTERHGRRLAPFDLIGPARLEFRGY